MRKTIQVTVAGMALVAVAGCSNGNASLVERMPVPNAAALSAAAYGQAAGSARVWDFTSGKAPEGGRLQPKAVVSAEGLGCSDFERGDARGGFLLNQHFTPQGAFLFEAEITVGGWAADQRKEHAGRLWDDMGINYGAKRPNTGLEVSLVQRADGYWVPEVHFGMGTDTYRVKGKQIRLPKGTRTKYAVYFGANGRVVVEFAGLVAEQSIPASGSLAPSRGYRPVIGSRPVGNYANLDGFVRRIAFTPMKRDPFVFRTPERTAFVRGEKDAALSIVAENRSEGSMTGVSIALEQFCAEGRVGRIETAVGDLAIGDAATVKMPIETRIVPGWHVIRATLAGKGADGKDVNFSTVIRYGIGPRYADTLRTVMWGLPAAVPTKALLDLGFTHGYIYLGGPSEPTGPFDPKPSYDVFDQALVDGLAIARIANCSFPPAGCTDTNKYVRYDCLHRPYKKLPPEVSNPELQERFRAIGARDAAYFADHPALQGVLPFSERRDHSKPSFNVEAKIYKQETGRDIPGHCLVDNRTFKLAEAQKRFPDGIVPEDDEIYLYYKWWLGGGDGWPKFLSGFFDEYHKRTANRPEFLSFWDPAVRWAPCWGSGGSADMLNQWCYAVPEPMNAAGPCEEILAMADGRPGQKASIMTQLICYRSKMAPVEEFPSPLPDWAKRFPKLKFPTIPPDVLTEATWSMLAKPVQAIMYHGWPTIYDCKGDSYYGFTNPESTVRIKSLLKDLVAPLGPTLKRLGREKPKVAVLESFTTCAMGGPASWGWLAPAVTFLQRARLDPRVVYEETILRDGLDDVQVLYAPQCRYLTPTIIGKLKEFQKRGGILVADRELVPAVKPDVTIPVVSFENPPETDYPEDVDKLEKAKAANQKTHRATMRVKEFMHVTGKTLRAELAKRGFVPKADSSSPEIVVYSRQWGQTPYLFALNDRRTFGDYVGQWGRVMEKGLPFEGWVTRKDSDARVNAVYELSRGEKVGFVREGDKVKVPVKYETNDGRLFVFLPSAIAAVEVSAPGSVRRGEAFDVTMRVLGEGGKPVPALLPVDIRVCDASGRELDGLGYACAEGGVAKVIVQTNLDDAPGAYEIVCRDRASGLEKRLTVR